MGGVSGADEQIRIRQGVRGWKTSTQRGLHPGLATQRFDPMRVHGRGLRERLHQTAGLVFVTGLAVGEGPYYRRHSGEPRRRGSGGVGRTGGVIIRHA